MKQQETLCWRCRNVGKRICPWDDSKGSEPTPGWTAIPQILQVDKRIVQSYIVVDCPMVDLENIEPNRGRKQKEVLDEDLVESMIDIECMEEQLRGQLGKPVTVGDRIRSISDEELASILVEMDEVDFCENRAECADDLCAGNDIPDERCKECALRWLRKPANERCAF